MSDLVLHLKYKFFDQIKRGEKTEEYRETKDYWRRRLEGRTFDRIVIVRGNYGNEKRPENVLVFPWNGYTVKKFGSWERQEMAEVFAITLRPKEQQETTIKDQPGGIER
jgi:hypothetical protein